MKNKFFLAITVILFASISSFAQLEGVKICIDPGHGGHNAANDRRIELTHGLIFWESEGNLMTGLHERDLLQSLGANVKMTRTENDDSDDISLSSRSTIANQFGADFFQSNHTNAGGGKYSLVLFKGTDSSPAWPNAKTMGFKIGANLQDLLRTSKNYNRGDKSFLGFNLGVLRNTNMPATLSEGSFHDFIPEAHRLKNTEYSKNYAWALAKSFCSYFDVDGFPTGRVGGIVTDRNTGDVINNVTVTCLPVNKTYLGDDFYNGFYAIGGLEPGTYTLTFSRSGYIDIIKTVTILANKYIDIDLSLPFSNNGAPYVDFDIDGFPAGTGDELTFDASKSADDGEIIKYKWDFGDNSEIDTNKITNHTYNADGDYIVKLVVTDNDEKSDSLSKTVQIKTTPPNVPVLLSVEPINDNKGVRIKWKKNIQTSLVGYRLYYSSNLDLENFQLLADTNILKPDIVEYSIDSIGDAHIYSFAITSINIANQESPLSDTYGTLNYSFDVNKKLLIVDGFHRRASYPNATHTFASTTYLRGLYDALGHLDVTTCLNESVIKGNIKLEDFDIVIWFVGDESTIDETFSIYDQNKIKDYLHQGGNLFVTGSEIGWDLDNKGTNGDKTFYHDYLKANFVSDGAIGRAPATGISESEFSDVILHYGEIYQEDYPDVIEGTGGAKSIFKYNEGSIAGIAYKGLFGSGSTPGALVHLSFPLETVKNKTELKIFFEKLLQYFDTTVGNLKTPICLAAPDIYIYPTIVNDYLFLESYLKEDINVKTSIYNLNGNKVYSSKYLLDNNNRKRLQLSELAKGAYILHIESEKYNKSYKFIKQ